MSLQPPATGEGPVFDRPRPSGDSKFLVVKRWWTQATRSLLAGKPLFASGVPGPGQRCFTGEAASLFLARPRAPDRRFRPGAPAWPAGRRRERGYLPPPAWHPPQALPYFPRALPPVLRPACQSQPGPADRADRQAPAVAVFLSHPGPTDHPGLRERPAVLHCLSSAAEAARCRRILPGEGVRTGGPPGRLEPAGPHRPEGWPDRGPRWPRCPPLSFHGGEPARLRPPDPPAWVRPPAWPATDPRLRPGLAGAAAGPRIPLWQRAERPLPGLPRPPAWSAAPLAAPLLAASRPGPVARGRLTARPAPTPRAAWPAGPGLSEESGSGPRAPGREPPPGLAPAEVPSPTLPPGGAAITPLLAPVGRVSPDPARRFPPTDRVARSALAPLAGLIGTRFRAGFPPAVFRPLRTIRLQARLLRTPARWEKRPTPFVVLTPRHLHPAFPAGTAARPPGAAHPDHADWARWHRSLPATPFQPAGPATGRPGMGNPSPESVPRPTGRAFPAIGQAVPAIGRVAQDPGRPSPAMVRAAPTAKPPDPVSDRTPSAADQPKPAVERPSPSAGWRPPATSLRPTLAGWAVRPTPFALFPAPGTGATKGREPPPELLPGLVAPQPAPATWRGGLAAFRPDGPDGFATGAGPFRDTVEMLLRPFPFCLLALEEPFNDIKDPPGRRRQPLRGALFAWLPAQPHPRRTEPLRQYRLSFPTPPAGFQGSPRPRRARLGPRRRAWPPLFSGPRSAFPRQTWKTLGLPARTPAWRLAFLLETSLAFPLPPAPLAILEPVSAYRPVGPRSEEGVAPAESAPHRRPLPLPRGTPHRHVAEPPFIWPPPWATDHRAFGPALMIGPFPFGFPAVHEREGRLWLLHAAPDLPLLGRFPLIDWPGPYLYQRRSRLRSPTNLRAPRRFLGPTLRLGTHFPYVMPFPNPFQPTRGRQGFPSAATDGGATRWFLAPERGLPEPGGPDPAPTTQSAAPVLTTLSTGPRMRQPPHQAHPRLPAAGPLPRLNPAPGAVLARGRPDRRVPPDRLPLRIPAGPFPFHQASPPPPTPDAGLRPGPLATSPVCRTPAAWLRGRLAPPAVDAAAVGGRGTGPAPILDLKGGSPALAPVFLSHGDEPAPACFPVPFTPLIPTLAHLQTRLYQGLPPSGFAPHAPRLSAESRLEPAPAMPFLWLEDEPCLSGLAEDGDFHILQIRMAAPAPALTLAHHLPTRAWRPWATPAPRWAGQATPPIPAWSDPPPRPPLNRVAMASRAPLPWRGVFPGRLPSLSRPEVPSHRLWRLRVATRFSAIGTVGPLHRDALWPAGARGTDISLPPVLHSPSSHWPVEAAGFACLALPDDSFPAGRNWPASWGRPVFCPAGPAPVDHGWLPSRRHLASRLPLFFRVRKEPLSLVLPTRPFPDPEVLVPFWARVHPPPRLETCPVAEAAPVLRVPEPRFRVQIPAPPGFDEILSGAVVESLPAPPPGLPPGGRDWRCPTGFPIQSGTPRPPPPRLPDVPDWLDLPTSRPGTAPRPALPIRF